MGPSMLMSMPLESADTGRAAMASVDNAMSAKEQKSDDIVSGIE